MTTYEEERTSSRTRTSDRFTDDRPRGTVVGSVGPAGARRLGVDVEGLIAIDNGALRLSPLEQPGWARQGIGYGPFEPTPGLAFAAHVLNGHNASQTFYFPETRKARLRRLLSDLRHRRPRRQYHHENLAVGLFPGPAVADPLRNAHSFVIHAATADNGELWTAHQGRPARAVLGLLNVPLVFVVALREQGAAYYLASVPGATGAGPYPLLHPVGIDPAPARGPFTAGLQQRILGEVGYHVDTRVYGIEVAVVDAWSGWYGSAIEADRLVGPTGPLDGREAERGRTWRADPVVRVGGHGATVDGQTPGAARLDVAEPPGLIHLGVRRGRRPATLEARWRASADGSYMAVVLSDRGCEVREHGGDGSSVVRASDPMIRLRRAAPAALQVLDDGERLSVQVDGQLVASTWVEAPSFDGTEVGLVLTGDLTVRDVEVHPRLVSLPADLECGAPWTPPPSGEAVHERFVPGREDGAASTLADLGGWRRDEGDGAIDLVDDGARVRASVAEPNPGRTIFTRAWDDPGFADLELEMTMPGTRRGEGHNGRCGVVFWQDPDNYLVVNLYVDDDFDGASISTFYHLGGEENMYDAVWTLVRGVVWGGRCTLRTVFDGERFIASTNGEPGLVRALRDVYPDTPPLRIERVGIIVNEEWGDDSGSHLHRFSTATRA